MKMRRWMANLI